MRVRSLLAGSFASSALLALLACSSSSNKDTTTTPDAAATGVDAGADTAPVYAGPDPKTACMKLTAMNTATQQKITLTAANRHPLAAAPKGMGGTIVDGTYRITGYDEYSDVMSATTSVMGTLQLQGGLYEIVLDDANSGGGSYEITGSNIAYFYGCGGVSAGPSGAPSGPVGVPTHPTPFTATATTITFIVPDAAGTITTVTTYTKD